MRTFLKTINLKRLLNLYNLAFAIILAIGVFSRFWNLNEFFTFNFDEEYQALMAWEQVKNFHPVWIGVSASNISYYLGPGITYLNALLFYVNKDPVILGLFGSFFGIVTAVSLFYVVKQLFSKNTALFAFAFYIGSTFINYFDRRFWNPTPIIFISIWMVYSLMKAKENTRWLILSFVLIAAALHIHLSLLAFWPIIIAVIWLNRKKIKLLTWTAMMGSFFLVTLPLFIFDLNHNFDNMLMPLRFLQKLLVNKHEATIFVGVSQLLNTLSRLWFMKPFTNVQDEIQLGVHGNISPTHIILTLFSLLIMILVMILSVRKPKYRILTASMLCFLAAYIFYPGGVVAYFLLGFIGLFCISVGLFLNKLPKYISIPIILIFMVINFYTLLTTQQKQFGLLTRKRLIQKVMTVVGNQPFYLETRTLDGRKYHSAGGWRYLFKAYGKTPAQSHADDFFGWIYQDEISKIKPEMRVIVSEYPTKLSQKPIAQFQEGVYYGFVIANEK